MFNRVVLFLHLISNDLIDLAYPACVWSNV